MCTACVIRTFLSPTNNTIIKDDRNPSYCLRVKLYTRVTDIFKSIFINFNSVVVVYTTKHIVYITVKRNYKKYKITINNITIERIVYCSGNLVKTRLRHYCTESHLFQQCELLYYGLTLGYIFICIIDFKNDFFVPVRLLIDVLTRL